MSAIGCDATFGRPRPVTLKCCSQTGQKFKRIILFSSSEQTGCLAHAAGVSQMESWKMKRQALLLLLTTALTGISGCTSLCDGVIEMEMNCRNKILAQKAWGHWSWCYGDLDYPWHFARGFKAGYRNVLDGGSGCQPTLPPQCYWKPSFQTPEGHCQIHAWFDGFSHGALAAKQDGYGSLGELPISPTARTNLELARTKPTSEIFYDGFGGGTSLGVGAPIPAQDNSTIVAPPAGTVNSGGHDPLLIQPPSRPYE